MKWIFVDQITDCDEETYIKGNLTFPKEDEWHEDHFPQSPIVPGVLQIEAGANFLGKLVIFRGLKENGIWVAPLLLKTFDCSFKGVARPGDCLEIEMRIDKWTRKIVRGTGEIRVDGKITASLSIAVARMDPSNAGDPEILRPWQIQQIQKCYPNPSDELSPFLEQG
ncbi:MAG: 3-hydroxyacyl-[acyl-carrier-protein] dehydratase [bacterium]|jgi:3-hydroxyacyl-[acyl-carrier-protein] dehydratase